MCGRHRRSGLCRAGAVGTVAAVRPVDPVTAGAPPVPSPRREDPMPHRAAPRRPVRPPAAAALVAITALVAPAAGTAGEGGEAAARARIETVSSGTSGAIGRRRAESALPLHLLAPADRARAGRVLDAHSLYRTLPVLRFPIHADGLRYFVQNPDVCVALWRVLGVSGCEMWQTGPNTYEADAGDGSVGVFEVLHRGEADQIVLVDGRFKSPVLSDPVRAKCLFHLHTRTAYGADGTPVAVGRASLFVSFPSKAVGAAAKLISPVTNVVLDRNFEEVCLFAHLMDTSMRRRPVWVEGLSRELDGVLPRRKDELVRLTAHVHAAARRREGVRRAGGGD